MTHQESLKLLGLSNPFGPSDLKSAFRRMALLYHPDKNPSPQAAKVFQECVLAYEVLGNYLLESDHTIQIPRVENLDDIFDDILGYSDETRILGFKNPDVIEISINEFLFGVNRKEKLWVYEKCVFCKGSGGKAKARTQLCSYCFGLGRIKNDQLEEKFCPKCTGRGRIIDDPCHVCNGFGRTPDRQNVRVDLKPGYQLGSTLSYSIHDPKKKSKIDLFLKPVLRKNSFFAVEKNQLVCHFFAPVSLGKEGGNIDFPSFWGWVTLPIPKGVNKVYEICLDGLGLMERGQSLSRGILRLVIEFIPDKEFQKMKKKYYQAVVLGNPNYHDSSKKSWWQKILDIS